MIVATGRGVATGREDVAVAQVVKRAGQKAKRPASAAMATVTVTSRTADLVGVGAVGQTAVPEKRSRQVDQAGIGVARSSPKKRPRPEVAVETVRRR